MLHEFQEEPKSDGQEGQQMSEIRLDVEYKVNSVDVRLYVATTWFELLFGPSICLQLLQYT
jgi:hypothetical protein